MMCPGVHMRLAIWWVVMFCAHETCIGRRRGYAISFQGENSVAGIRKGFIDWSDPGFVNITSNLTISSWVKHENGKQFNVNFQIGSSEGSLITEFFMTLLDSRYSCDFEKRPTEDGFVLHRAMDWHYMTMVVASGTVKTYLNGTHSRTCAFLEGGVMDHMYTLRKPGSTFHLGGALMRYSGPIKEYVVSSKESSSFQSGFIGKMDDFGIWTRALAREEIVSFMEAPVNVSDIPNDLAVYYNFDELGCASNGEYNSSCGSTELNVVKNFGVAGNGYDLLLGQLNNDYGYGKSWIDYAEKDLEVYTLQQFNTPTISVESAPVFESVIDCATTPTVIQVFPDRIVEFDLPNGFSPVTLLTTPTIGVLSRGSDNTTLGQGDSLSGESALKFSWSADGEASLPLKFAISIVDAFGANYEHSTHVWPYLSPKLIPTADITRGYKKFSMEGYTKEGVPVYYWLKKLGFSPTGEELDLQIVSLPSTSRVKLFQLESRDVVKDRQRKRTRSYRKLGKNETIQSRYGMELGLSPQPGVFGYEYISFVLFSPKSGMKTEVVELRVQIFQVDNLPTSKGSSGFSIEEDSKDGRNIDLIGNDEEERYGLLFAIQSLPKKGKLYKQATPDGERVLIDSPYSEFDQGGKSYGQYASGVTAVSSFKLTGDLLNMLPYHPLNVLGPPSCEDDRRQHECTTVPAAGGGPLAIGTLILADVYSRGSPLHAPDKTPLYLPGRIKSYGKGSSGTYSVEIIPMYMYGNGSGVRCILDRGQENKRYLHYPEDCNPTPFVNRESVVINDLALGVHMRYHARRYWEPASQGYQGQKMIQGGPFSTIFGQEYNYSHNQSLYYREGNEPAYTEYIEVTFNSSVYPVFVEVGSSFGGGGIVAVKALNPKGKWVYLFSDSVNKHRIDIADKTESYYYFDEWVCRQNFKTNTLRVELDTTYESGNGKTNTIDYIKLVGTPSLQSSVLDYGSTSITYIPDPNAFGTDSFSFKTADCGGKVRRSSAAASVDIQIEPEVDAPSIESTPLQLLKCIDATSSTYLNITLSGTDVDLKGVKLFLETIPPFGEIIQEAQIELGDALYFNQVGSEFTTTFKYGIECSDPRTVTSIVHFNVSAVDSSGAIAHARVTIRILKEAKSVSTYAKTISYVCFAINEIVAIFLFFWVVWNRFHPVILASQIHFLLLIIVGVMISSSQIYIYVQDDQEPAGKEGADSWCKVLPFFYTLGFLVVYTCLYAKLYKVSKLFDLNFTLQMTTASGDQKRRMKNQISTRTLVIRVLLMWAIGVLLTSIYMSNAPLYFKRIPVLYDPVETDFVLKSVGFCQSDDVDVGMYMFMVEFYHLYILLRAAFLCFKTRNIHDAFSEGKHFRFAILSQCQIFMIGIPLLMFMGSNPEENLFVFVETCMTWLKDLTLLGFIFLPKVQMVYQGVREGGAGFEQIDNAIKLSVSSNGSSLGTFRSRLTRIKSGPMSYMGRVKSSIRPSSSTTNQ